jgi:hypothetical protein
MSEHESQQARSEERDRASAQVAQAERSSSSSSTRRALDDATNDVAARRPARPARDDDDDDDDGWFSGITRSVSNVARRATRAASNVAERATNTVSNVAQRATNTVSDVAERASSSASDLAGNVAQQAERAVLGDELSETPDLPEGQTAEGRPRRVELGRDEDDESGGLLGLVSRGVQRTGDLAASAVRAAAPVADYVLHGEGSADEWADEIEDASAAAADVVDEDIRGELEEATGRPVVGSNQVDTDLRMPTERGQRDVRERTRTLFDALDGAGTDPTQVREALRGASPETIEAMRAEYARTHEGRDMLRDIDRDVSGSLENEIEGLLTGDPVEQALATIEGSTHGLSTDQHAMMESIREVPADRRDEVIAAMSDQEEGGTPEERRRRVEERFERESGHADGRVAMALLENREADAIAYRLDDELNNGVLDVVGRALGNPDLGSPDEDEVIRIMEGIPAERREAVIDAYDGMPHRGGRIESLESALDRELDGPVGARAEALREGNRAAADAHAIRQAAEEPWYESQAVIGAALLATPLAPIGAVVLIHAAANEACNGGTDLNSTDTEGLIGVIERRPGEEPDQYDVRIRATRDEFNRAYGGDDPAAFDEMLADELGEGSRDHVRATNTMENHGEMDWRVQLDYATERRLWSTDEEEAIESIQRGQASGMSATEREQISEQIDAEMDGRYALEAHEALEGEPQTPQGWIDRWERRHQLDRDTVIGSDITDLHSSAGQDYDRHMEELRGLVDQSGNVRPGQEARFEELRATMEGDQASYRTRQDEATEVAVQVATTAVTVTAMTAATVLSAGTLAPAAIAGGATLLGGGAGMLTRAGMQGDAYEREDIARDGIEATVNALGAGGTQAIQTAMPANSLLTRAIAAAPEAGLSGATELALSEDEIDLGDLGEQGLRGGGQIAGSALGETVEDAIGGPAPGLHRRMLGAGMGGGLENMTETSTELDTYDDGALEALGRIASSGARGVAESSVFSMTEHVADQRERTRAHQERTRTRFDENLRGSEGHPARAAAEAQANRDTADSLIREIVESDHPTSTTRDVDPDDPSLDDLAAMSSRSAETTRTSWPASGDNDTSASLIDDVVSQPIGSTGMPFDPARVPGPGERPNYPPNDGFASEPVQAELAPGTELHRVNSPHGTYFSPAETSIEARALPPRYGPNGEHAPHLRQERFYTVGESGMLVDQGPAAAAFGEPGGGPQLRSIGAASASELEGAGVINLEQENIATIAEGDDLAEIEAAVAQEALEEDQRARAQAPPRRETQAERSVRIANRRAAREARRAARRRRGQ